jgi:hypothetical protein
MKLEQFIVKAKISAYAGGGEGGERILADGCKELTFQEGDFTGTDILAGIPLSGKKLCSRVIKSCGR